MDRKVSIVVPCHNYGRFLGQAVHSVLEQTRSVDEIVIVDDGSTDDTVQVVERLRAARPDLRFLTRHPARGAVRTFNDGVRASSGELVVVLSADDRMSPRYVEELEKAIRATGAAFAYAPTHLFGAKTEVWPGLPFDARRLARINYINGSAMFTRELYDCLDGFNEAFERLGLEDWAFWLAAVASGSTGAGVTTDGCWLEYRQHEQGSRNPGGVLRTGRAHWILHRRYPDVVGKGDVLWLAQHLARTRFAAAAPGVGERSRATVRAIGAKAKVLVTLMVAPPRGSAHRQRE